MKKYFYIHLLIISIFFVTNIVGQNKSYNRTDDNCEDSAPHLKTEFNAWKKEAIKLNASSASNDLQTLELNIKTTIQLHPQNELKFTTAPQKTFTEILKPFAGIISLKIKQDGLYRISAGDRVWFDVINAQTKQIVEASSFEMQPPCNKIFKIVTFDLKAGTNYILQISSSTKPQSIFLFSKQL